MASEPSEFNACSSEPPVAAAPAPNSDSDMVGVVVREAFTEEPLLLLPPPLSLPAKLALPARTVVVAMVAIRGLSPV